MKNNDLFGKVAKKVVKKSSNTTFCTPYSMFHLFTHALFPVWAGVKTARAVLTRSNNSANNTMNALRTQRMPNMIAHTRVLNTGRPRLTNMCSNTLFQNIHRTPSKLK